MTGRNVKDLSLKNVNLIFLGRKCIPKGCQFSCHLITGRNVKDLSVENVDLILFMLEGVLLQLPPYNR